MNNGRKESVTDLTTPSVKIDAENRMNIGAVDVRMEGMSHLGPKTLSNDAIKKGMKRGFTTIET